jgi:hypothetical protein
MGFDLTTIYLVIFVIQLISLFYISRQTINELFHFLRIFFKADQIVFGIVSMLFLPGTILHEMSHFLVATILLLKVREVHIFPTWDRHYIKLGRVVYEKQDVIRSIIVGVAPVFVGLLFFWWMSAIDVLFIEGIGMRMLVIYIIFVISSSMFSSKQDLIDIVYVIPFIMILGFIVYVFQIDLMTLIRQPLISRTFTKFLYDVNMYLAISLAIHIVICIVLVGIQRIIYKR